MADLLQETYLPEFEKKQIRDSNVYKLLKENNEDTSVLEGFEHNPKYTPIEIKDFDTFINEGGTKEDWIAKHATPERKKEFFGAIGDFIYDTGKDTALSLGVAAINGADVATNLMPIMAKVLDNSPLVTGMPNGFMNAKTEKEIYDAAKYVSDNLGSAREYLKSFKEDDNVVSQLIGIMGQDLVYSVPIYNKLRDLGVSKYPAFFISGGIGGAIGIEDKIFGEESTFSLHYGAKEIEGLKNLIGILPNTPEDQIADEVVQALEYGAFSVAIPGIIDAFKFMKRYIPAFAGGAAIATVPGDAEANPIKAIANAVFKSTAKEAVEQKITKGSGEQIFNTIKNTPGVKESELKWIGLESFLKDKKNVTQQEVLDFIEANKIDVNERRFGDFVDTAESKKSKPIHELDFKDARKIQRRIYEEAENNNDESLKFVADHIDYLRAAGGKRIDNFPIKKTEYMEGYDAPTITDQTYNFSNFMSDHALYRVVEGLDDFGSGPIGIDYFDNTFANYYEVFGIKSKGTKNLLTDDMEKKLYTDFAENTNLPEEMVRNADVNNGFHIQADEFENFKKYLDENGAYIMKYNHMEIPKMDVRVAVFNEMNIRSNEEMYFQYGRGNNMMDALGEWTDTAFMPQGKWIGQTEPGGENYSELVFTLSKGGENVGTKFPMETPITKSATNREFNIRTSPHFNVPGEFAHVRFKTRMQGNMKVLSVEEMQSDLVQRSKQFNQDAISNQRAALLSAESTKQQEANVFKNLSEDDIQQMLKDNPPNMLIKDFPFKNTWYELTLKRLIRYAADNGFDAISIPKGSVIQDRYGLTRRIDDFQIGSFDPVRREVGLEAWDQNEVLQISELYSFERVKREFGEDVLDRIIKKGKSMQRVDENLEGEFAESSYDRGDNIVELAKTIEIGGEGKNQLYNKTIPAFLKKYGKKWNAKVYDDKIRIGDFKDPRPISQVSDREKRTFNMPVTIIEITPEMKKSVQGTPQPLFEIFGGVGLSTWIADEVSDSMQNNIISQTTN